jgi:hypothetical protein
MRTVEDGAGTRYLLVKRSSESSLVRDPETGEEQYLPNEELEMVDDSPLDAAALSIPDATRQVLAGVPSRRGLGLLVVLDEEPRGVRWLLDSTDLCESDLNGLVTGLRAAGLVAETEVGGERGYRTTDVASEGLADLRDRD